MGTPFEGFTPRYSAEHKALCYWHVVELPGRFPRRTRNGLKSQPMLRVTLLRDHVCLSVEHHYTSSHMWNQDWHRDPVQETLAALALEHVAQQGRDIQAEQARWEPAILLQRFTPMRGDEPWSCTPAEALWLELGVSFQPEGKLPNLTLRLGREEDQIVQDYSFSGGQRVRRLEPVSVPATLDDIAAHFGADMAAAAMQFAADRGRWFR